MAANLQIQNGHQGQQPFWIPKIDRNFVQKGYIAVLLKSTGKDLCNGHDYTLLFLLRILLFELMRYFVMLHITFSIMPFSKKYF